MNDFDVLLIGAGQANIPLARSLGDAGKRVGLIERKHLGGSCVNFGCTPSKAVLASARAAYVARRLNDWGIRDVEVKVDFPAVIRRAQAVVKASVDSLRNGLREAGVAIINGHARLDGMRDKKFVVKVFDQQYTAATIVLDSGTRTRIPPIEGLSSVNFIEAGNWLRQDTIPERLTMIGGGYIGLEMAQFYRRMGSRVTVIESGKQIVAHEDADIAAAIQARLEKEQIAFELETDVTAVRRGSDDVSLDLTGAKGKRTVNTDAIFVATGRQPNTEDLGLETIGLNLLESGLIEVDRHFQTRVKGVYAVGDIRGGPQFTNTSWDDHRVLENQLLGEGARKTSERIVPYAVFTDPELGRVGMTEKAARDALGDRVEVKKFELSSNGRASVMGEDVGLIKLVIDAKSDKILGAAVFAPHGAELVSVYIALMNAGASLDVLRNAIFIHPTLSEAVQSVVM